MHRETASKACCASTHVGGLSWHSPRPTRLPFHRSLPSDMFEPGYSFSATRPDGGITSPIVGTGKQRRVRRGPLGLHRRRGHLHRGPQTPVQPAGGDGPRDRRSPADPSELTGHRRAHRRPGRFLCLPINTNKYVSHGQSIWMYLMLNRWPQSTETTDLPSFVERRTSADRPTGSSLIGWASDDCKTSPRSCLPSDGMSGDGHPIADGYWGRIN